MGRASRSTSLTVDISDLVCSALFLRHSATPYVQDIIPIKQLKHFMSYSSRSCCCCS